ncbi:MMPL family transporter [Allostreptomyces psammosilenae]|uniref:RND superfamily putative drug exporter n=1 Tax=Allostreptomyces psammosilenae TaxID=1892865 RepID=A0A852ZPE4_9ACTN|nr:MMPL family transporter [Allostreptomyces psammosilenae]NYI03347.1 RND superfamily putative drug exporter [Allostreptomyces psammosilenae]
MPVTSPSVHHGDLVRPSALRRLGALIARRSRTFVWVSVVLAVLAAAVGAGAMDRLVLSRFESPGSESLQTADILASEFDTGKPHIAVLVTAQQGRDVDDPEVAAAGQAVAEELAAMEGVAEVASYWGRGNSPALRGEDGMQAVIVARLAGDVTEARTNLAEISPEITREDELISVAVGGGDEVFRQAAEQAREDFLFAELIVTPLVLLCLFLVYRRFRVAALTLGMGLFSVVATLALLRIVTYITDVSTFAANLTLVMGLGLGVDYCLFIINRFREELERGRSVAESIEETVATAGRTVAFSALTVAVSLVCLMFFPFPFLRSFAYAGVGVVLTSVFAALIILPAALTRLGHRAARRKPARTGEGSGWHRMALRMMRRPVIYGVPALAVVLVLGSPTLGLNFGLPDDRVLPPETSSRQVQQQIRDNFAQEEMDALQVVTMGVPGTADNTATIEATATELSALPGVAQVDALTGSYRGGERILPAVPDSERFAGESDTWFSVIPTNEALGGDINEFMDQLAAVPDAETIHIGGYPAELADFRAALIERVPLVFGLILLVTFVILFLMTGSLLLPLKATLLNVTSMAVMFGVLVWLFQEGNLSDIIGFTAIGTLEPTFPILMFCIAFGLSMDYEVFMMSRIKEEYDRTGDNSLAVAHGLERSGPLITAAAVILAASFATYAFSGIMYLQMLGIGMAIVILVDATLIRAVLVPVFMRLAGNANWWAPGPLRRLHERFGISEEGDARAVPAGTNKPVAGAAR